LDWAEHWFDDALKLDEDDGPAYLARAMTRLKFGKLSEAAQDAEQAVRYNPQDPEAYFVRALVRLRQRNRSGAAADLRKALRIAPAEWSRRQEAQDVLTKL
jgi:tetratricopeptide (TPR) repeat protein